MALDLHIAGPGLDVNRRLQPGDPALILGRDAECTVCLPDPERNISRRHLSVWNDGDALHFQVLSVVNGVELPEGELPPGASGILSVGASLTLSAYQLTVRLAPPAVAPEEDPWTVFERQAAELTPTEPGLGTLAPADEDPFGDWGFQSTFGPGSPNGRLSADALAAASNLRPFLTGLGIDGEQRVLTQGELEAIGRLTRLALQGLLQALQSTAGDRAEGPAGERTTVEARVVNPLRLDLPLEAKLQYLFGGQGAAAGFLPPERALAQLVGDLLAHQEATSEAVRDAVQGILAEFDPESLKGRLLRGGPKLFESGRAWEAFARDYAQRKSDLPAWVRQLVDHHFAAAYAAALTRVKRDTAGRRPG